MVTDFSLTTMKPNDKFWYVIKQQDGTCQIVDFDTHQPKTSDQWGAYATEQEAIAKKIGLIRAGKCKPQ